MNILYIIDCAKIYGGTPKKSLDLIKYSQNKFYLYFYLDKYQEHLKEFEQVGAKVFRGFYKKNLFKHIKALLNIIDVNNIKIVQTQHSMGATLGYMIKIFRPHIKLVIAFVGKHKPGLIKSSVLKRAYIRADTIVYVSKYIQDEKIRQFPKLKNKNGRIIYNGTNKRKDNGKECIELKNKSLLCISSLIKLKNIQVLIKAMNIIINKYKQTTFQLYIAGDGVDKKRLESLVIKYGLIDHIIFLGNQKNIGKLLNMCEIFLHPSLAEGFGIAVTEAMMSEKAIIASNAGALPELITNQYSGILVDPLNAKEWAENIVNLANNKNIAKQLGENAKLVAEKRFSIDFFIEEYNGLYNSLI